MSKAYSLGITTKTMTNESTTTMPAYTFVRLCTTHNAVDLITTKGEAPFGITQEAINPSDNGKIAPGCLGGISKCKMASTALTTYDLPTTPYYICAAANGRGVKITTTTTYAIAQPMCTFAASDIVPVRRGLNVVAIV